MSHQQSLLQLAGRQLNIRQDKVPQDYLRQLRLHPNAYGQDSNIRRGAGDGYGVVLCQTCDTEIKLGGDGTREDGGRSLGIGSLDAYTEHCLSSTHTALLAVSAPSSSTSGARMQTVPVPSITDDNSSSPYWSSRKSVSGLGALFPSWLSGTRKRASDSDADNPELSPKRIKLEPTSEPDQITREESPELGTPPRPRPKPSGSSVVALSTKPLQVVERFGSPAVLPSTKLNAGVVLHPFFRQTANVASTVHHIAPTENELTLRRAPYPAPAVVPPTISPALTSHVKRENSPVIVKIEKEENVTQALTRDPNPVDGSTFRKIPPDVAAQSSRAVEQIPDWIHNAALAETFQENATVQTSLQQLGLTEQAHKLPGMQISLLPHQIIGVAWMYEQETSKRIGHYGGILADEMGLGKTVQMIATMMVNRPVEGKEKGTLIVCPVGLLDQWKSEIETKTTGLCKLYVHHGPNRTKSHRELHKYDVVLTTYSTLAMDLPPTAVLKAKDSPEDELENPHKCGPLLKAKWYRIVLDEAQIIRNRTTRTSSAAARLKSILRWCLTGTPIINSLSDAFSMMRVLRIRPWYEWQHFYQNIVKNEKSNPTLSGKRLQGVFKSCLLRRNKNSMLDGKRLIELPEKKVDTVVLDFCEEERAIYSMVEKKAQAVFNRFLRQGTVLKNYSHVFSLIMRLRQCACHPALIQEEYDEAVIEADDEERKTNEIERAQQLVSSDFVEQMKTRLLHTAQERMRQEQDSLDNQLDDDCPICFENIDDGVVTPCQHAYCRACALKLFDKPNDEHLRMSHDQRPCPSCRAPFLRELLFWRRAFEPTDADLEIHDTDDNIPVKGYQILEDRDDDLPVTKRSRPKSTTLPAWMRESSDSEEDEDEDEDEEEDSLSDFIVESDEDEAEKDARKAAKRKKKGKRPAKDGRGKHEYDKTDVGFKANRKPKAGKVPRFLPSTKMKAMMKSLKAWRTEDPDDKTIVVSQFVSALDVVAGYLEEQRFQYVRYQGTMTKEARQNAVKKFMGAGGPTVMLMSLKAGGVGLNLTRGNRVISLDLGWSEAVEAQAFDRVHRLGQSKDVLVQRLVIQNTIEDRILHLHKRKQGLADHSLGEGSGKKISRLSVRDLMELFGQNA